MSKIVTAAVLSPMIARDREMMAVMAAIQALGYLKPRERDLLQKTVTERIDFALAYEKRMEKAIEKSLKQQALRDMKKAKKRRPR